jgi:two-component sensor histidine kinase
MLQMLKRVLLLILLLWLWTDIGTIKAQTFSMRHYTVEDGLPSNVVYSTTRDKKGYLWFATDKGIARYDGFRFKTFTISDGLPDNEIFGLKEDNEQRLWMYTFNGVLCYYKDGIIHTEANTPWLKLQTQPAVIQYIKLEKDGSLSFSLETKKFIFNIHHETIKYIPLTNLKMSGLLAVIFFTKCSTSKYRIFLGHTYIDVDTTGSLLGEYNYPDSCKFNAAISATDEYLYGKKGLYNADLKLVYPINKVPFDSSVLRINIENRNIFLSGKSNGLYINEDSLLLKDLFITHISRDQSGNYWVSTKGSGVYSLNKDLLETLEYENVYKEQVLYAKVVDSKLLFVDNRGTIFQLEKGTTKLTDKCTANINLTKGNFSISGNSDYFRVYNHRDTLKVRTGIGGHKKDIIIPSGLKGYVKEILISGDYLYIVTISSIYRLSYKDIVNNKPVVEVVVPYSINDFSNRIYARALDKTKNQLWFNRIDGMYQLIGTQLVRKDKFKGILFKEFAFFGQYLIGFTNKNKLLIYNNYDANAVVDSIIEKNCIWENIYPIDDHRVIISTNNYYRLISLYPPLKNGKPRYTIQTIEDPFVPTQAEYIAADSNNCYFFKKGTITHIATSVLFEKTPPPIPVFSSFKTLNKSYLIRPEIKISYDQSKNINIVFDNISFTGKDITCQYSITDNGKDQWREITGNEINLNTPGYGTYLVKVRSKTLSSGYSKPAVIRLIVQKPFWATWWFISLCALALIALVWGIIIFITWRKLHKKQKEHEADMKYQQSEYKALNALMNPHFIFNSLNNIQGLINKDEKRIANEYLVIFSDLVRQNMHNISKGFISLQQELTLIENYLTLEKLRFKELVNYEINIGEDVDVDDIMIPPLMIQPLVENAVKHGLLPKQSASSKVSVQVYEKDNLLYIVIEDNGVGLTQSLQSENKLHESFGLSNLQKRTEHLKKIQEHEINIEVTELKNSDGTVKGTQAVVTIKLIEA